MSLLARTNTTPNFWDGTRGKKYGEIFGGNDLKIIKLIVSLYYWTGRKIYAPGTLKRLRLERDYERHLGSYDGRYDGKIKEIEEMMSRW